MQTAVGSNEFGTSLRSVLDYSFSTPLKRVQIAETSAPTNRFRRVVNDLLQGKQIKLVAVGGVATNGSNASNPGSNDYIAIYANYLMRAFPGAKVEVQRQSVGLAPSPVVAGCVSTFMPDDADLVLLEMTANDAIILDPSISGSQPAMAYEVLVRQALSGSKKPAVMLAQVRTGLMPGWLTRLTHQLLQVQQQVPAATPLHGVSRQEGVTHIALLLTMVVQCRGWCAWSIQ
jgi:hypothetical protein